MKSFTKGLSVSLFLSSSLSFSACQFMTGPIQVPVGNQGLSTGTAASSGSPNITIYNNPTQNNQNNNVNQQTNLIQVGASQYQTTSSDIAGIKTVEHLVSLNGANPQQLQSALEQTQGKLIEQKPHQVTIELPASQSPKQLVKKLEDQGIAASPIYVFEPQVIRHSGAPVATLAERQSDSATQDPHWLEAQQSWGQRMIRQPEALQRFASPMHARAGEIEFGVEAHPDLPSFTQHGQNSSDADHGNHVAGIVAAIANNQQGLAGIAPGEPYTAITVCKTMNCITEGVRTAADQDLDVVNISLGVHVTDPVSDQDLRDMVTRLRRDFEPAVDFAEQQGLTLVVSAGNGLRDQQGRFSRDLDASLTMPAALASDHDNVISVAAVDSQGAKADFSNFGDSVTLAAPGVEIYSAINNNTYAFYSGTSMAAPMVTAAVRWLKSRYPDLQSAQIKDLLRSSVSRQVSGHNFGVLDLVSLMELADQRYGSVTPPGPVLPPTQPPVTPIEPPPSQLPNPPGYFYQLLDVMALQGGGTWGDIFVTAAELQGDELILRVRKRDGSPIKNRTHFYLKVGSYLSTGVDHDVQMVDPATSGDRYEIVLRDRLSRWDAQWEPYKTFWVRAENSDGYVYSGGIRVLRR